MAVSLPEYFFRLKENGAAVFRVDTENRHQRIEMEQIATVNPRNGEIRRQGARPLTDADRAAIADWLDERQALTARREWDAVLQTVDHLNLTAQWAQAKATPEELEQVSDALLMAMHDLRSVLVRKLSDRLKAKESGPKDAT